MYIYYTDMRTVYNKIHRKRALPVITNPSMVYV